MGSHPSVAAKGGSRRSSTAVWRNYGLATTLGDLLGAGQRADRWLNSAASLLHLPGSEAGPRQRSTDRATRSGSRDGQDAPPQDVALQTGLAERGTRLAFSTAD